MLDVSVSYERYKFLGHEFLTYMWFLIETDQDKFGAVDDEFTGIEVGNRIVLEHRLNDDSLESITIKGDDADLEEGMLALRKGAVVTEMNLVYKTGSYEWRFTIKGENFNIGNLKVPETGEVESKEEVEGALLERISLYEKSLIFVDNMFKNFIQLRISGAWNKDVVPLLKGWIYKHN